ncbi:hypothetical protein GQ55_5G502900 [Panicum hallii var. hallii]|uniref:Uncharacterized protein n=1 Tax=Panicum hallii var. hallii TaxID=1504633 RepID=A0A2T7DRZ8_9POAL|nr:hypothetical protein GQ55_5G502900 [Panicum hallii var. hallii]
MQQIASSYLESYVKVHKISKTQFIMLPSDKCAAPIVSEVLLQISEFKFPAVTFSLDRWSDSNMSVLETLQFKIDVTLNRIPAHLCVPKNFGFLLRPYCSMEVYDGPQPILTTCEKFKCTAWINDVKKVPKRIMTALIHRRILEQHRYLSMLLSHIGMKLAIFQYSIIELGNVVLKIQGSFASRTVNGNLAPRLNIIWRSKCSEIHFDGMTVAT